MTTEVSPTRLYLGNLPRTATKADVESHFQSHGTGKITEIKLMNGFGFIEYEDAMDARDVVPDGSDFMGERLVVQFARGSRRNPEFQPQERTAPRPRRTPFRMSITGLPTETSWQDLKDFARSNGLDVVYSEVSRERDGRGFVEYETQADLRKAVDSLDNHEFKGQAVHCVVDVSLPSSLSGYRRGCRGWKRDTQNQQTQEDRPRDRYRSRSPQPWRRYGPPPDDYYDRRGALPPPRGYTPQPRDDYRRRSPPRRDYYERDRYAARSPRRGPPVDDYPPPRARYPDDPYDARGPPPPRRGYDDPYINGHGRYDRPPSPRRGRTPPPRPGYEDGYRGRPYW
ncbi:hypothetical protein BDY21DRAFT_293162 [Lineolata rhizophorae]|uniref:RRM domain-containing protein n=1 Tax=Lineolata rhizophorae TaxID=578093 RepID=A0A6A6NNQ9_9PEZI|nr:hypothetical protein BDY21DRAFT_293162 [Lineolata rhizophorae]